MNEIDIAWAAGFLDGEGCFNVYKSVSKSYESVRSFVRANQAATDAPIRKLHQMFGGNFWERGHATVTGKRVFEWQIQAKGDLERVLPLLMPHLIVKRDQAELVLELAQYQTRKGGRGGNPYKEQRLEVLARYDAVVGRR